MQGVIAIAVTYGSVKVAMNGLEATLIRHEEKLDGLTTSSIEHGERLARMEGAAAVQE